MFSDPLRVKVEDDKVTLSVRTCDERVDEYVLTVDAFKEVVFEAKVKELEFAVHFYIPVTENHRVAYAVKLYTWNIMLAQYQAQVGG